MGENVCFALRISISILSLLQLPLPLPLLVHRHGKAEMFPILNLLNNTPQPIPNALDGIAPQQQPQRRIAAMAELPHQLGALDGARGLAVIQPLYDALGVAGGAAGTSIGGACSLDPEEAVALEARGLGGALDGLVQPHVARLDQRRFDVEHVDLVQHRLDEPFDGVLGRAVGPQPRHAERAGRRGEDEVAAV